MVCVQSRRVAGWSLGPSRLQHPDTDDASAGRLPPLSLRVAPEHPPLSFLLQGLPGQARRLVNSERGPSSWPQHLGWQAPSGPTARFLEPCPPGQAPGFTPSPEWINRGNWGIRSLLGSLHACWGKLLSTAQGCCRGPRGQEHYLELVRSAAHSGSEITEAWPPGRLGPEHPRPWAGGA